MSEQRVKVTSGGSGLWGTLDFILPWFLVVALLRSCGPEYAAHAAGELTGEIVRDFRAGYTSPGDTP